ncbi:hypothetical protein DB31_0587 [Hyalangium minutum]|uniref:Uncharacterized protein n=1 Tax=Hyalangium minutum TaxID=394096 RepID=A0A085WXB2_9BACT|nr:hypothetical protein DB31_0587 [Hyalangium minutum]
MQPARPEVHSGLPVKGFGLGLRAVVVRVGIEAGHGQGVVVARGTPWRDSQIDFRVNRRHLCSPLIPIRELF